MYKRQISRIGDIKQIIPLAEDHIEQKHEFPKRIIVQKGTKYVTLSINEIYHIEAYGDYSKLHTISDTFISNHGISTLEEKLDPKEFLRIHRSTIVHLDKIKEVAKYGKSYMLILLNQENVKVSRGYADKIKALMF